MLEELAEAPDLFVICIDLGGRFLLGTLGALGRGDWVGA